MGPDPAGLRPRCCCLLRNARGGPTGGPLFSPDPLSSPQRLPFPTSTTAPAPLALPKTCHGSLTCARPSSSQPDPLSSRLLPSAQVKPQASLQLLSPLICSWSSDLMVINSRPEPQRTSDPRQPPRCRMEAGPLLAPGHHCPWTHDRLGPHSTWRSFPERVRASCHPSVTHVCLESKDRIQTSRPPGCPPCGRGHDIPG